MKNMVIPVNCYKKFSVEYVKFLLEKLSMLLNNQRVAGILRSLNFRLSDENFVLFSWVISKSR